MYASLESAEDVFTVGLNRAVDLIAEKKNNPRTRRGPQALKELGNDPSGTAIKLMKGRYGPYVTDGDTNATVPDADNAENITLEQALALIADRAAKGGGKKKKKPAAKPKKAAASKEPKAKAEKATPANKKTTTKSAKKKPEPVAGE
jgi:DNA topoisomerase-1